MLYTHIQLALQQSGHTETSSRVRVHMCRTPLIRLSMTSSSIWASGPESQSHTKTRSRSRFVGPGLGPLTILQWGGGPLPAVWLWLSVKTRTKNLLQDPDPPHPSFYSAGEDAGRTGPVRVPENPHWIFSSWRQSWTPIGRKDQDKPPTVYVPREIIKNSNRLHQRTEK